MLYQREKGEPALFAEMLPLFELHYKEIAAFQDIPLKPDFMRYEQIEQLGFLRAYTARTEFGELVGYAVFFVNWNLHYSTSLQAVQDILFIHPEHRGTGARLIKWADEQLKLDGVQTVAHHVKSAHNFGPLLERMGYRCVDLIYVKRLDTPAEVSANG